MIVLRLATKNDVQPLIDPDPLSQQDIKRIPFINHAIDSGICHILEDQDILVGYGILSHDFYQYGFIEMLYIHPSFRRKGLATLLMDYMENLCKTEKLFTSTNQSNKPAQALFESKGYVPSGVIENLDEGDPELIYFKRLKR
jgi:ribosomal protein S18 acetylase RimI-like enzyme